jgi:hypothetical protein
MPGRVLKSKNTKGGGRADGRSKLGHQLLTMPAVMLFAK